MERFYRIIPLIKRNDPTINTVSIIEQFVTGTMVDVLIGAINCNTFITKVVFDTNDLSVESCNKIFDLIITNPKLCRLEVINNNVSDISIQHLSENLRKVPQSRNPIDLNLRRNKITQVGAEYLASSLSSNSPIGCLDIRHNEKVGDKGLESIALSLSNNTTLTILDIIGCGLNEDSAAALSDALTENHTLTTLLIEDKLNLRTIYSLGELFSDPLCSLQSLYLWRCSLDAELLKVLCRNIKKNTSLRKLALSYNNIDDTGSISLADIILNNKSLKKLQLGANSFTETAAGYFGVALAKNDTLQFLDLSKNKLKSHGVWPIAISLMNNTALQSIDLRCNSIDSSGVEIICELLSNNKSICDMKLSGNMFDDNSIVLIADVLKSNNSLKEIELSEVGMGSRGFVSICNALKSNCTLERITVSFNHLTANCLSSFADLMKVNSSLKIFEMSNCEIDDEGCSFIADGIASNSSLINLDISSNLINTEGALMLIDAMQGNYTLYKMDIKKNPFCFLNEYFKTIANKMSDFLERNNYYKYNNLMKDMSALAFDQVYM